MTKPHKWSWDQQVDDKVIRVMVSRHARKRLRQRFRLYWGPAQWSKALADVSSRWAHARAWRKGNRLQDGRVITLCNGVRCVMKFDTTHGHGSLVVLTVLCD